MLPVGFIFPIGSLNIADQAIQVYFNKEIMLEKRMSFYPNMPEKHFLRSDRFPKVSRSSCLLSSYHWMAEVKNDSIIDSDIFCWRSHSFTKRLIWKWISENENILFWKQDLSILQAKKSFKTLEKSKKIRYNVNNHLS